MSFSHDVLYAFRDFRRHPGIPIVIVLSLGAAMGITLPACFPS